MLILTPGIAHRRLGTEFKYSGNLEFIFKSISGYESELGGGVSDGKNL
jgi:hypothetical protein